MFTLKSIEIGVVWRVLGEELCIGTTLTVVIFKENPHCAILQMGNTMVESFMSNLNIKNEDLRELNNLIILGTKRNEGDNLPSWEVHCGVGNFKIFITCRIDGCQNWLIQRWLILLLLLLLLECIMYKSTLGQSCPMQHCVNYNKTSL